RNAAPGSAVEKERPDLRLRQQNEPGSDGRQGALDRTGEVEREGEDGAAGLRVALRESATRGGGDGKTQAHPGSLPGERTEQSPSHPDLSDGHRVNPDAPVQIGIGGEPEPPPDISQAPASGERTKEGVG